MLVTAKSSDTPGARPERARTKTPALNSVAIVAAARATKGIDGARRSTGMMTPTARTTPLSSHSREEAGRAKTARMEVSGDTIAATVSIDFSASSRQLGGLLPGPPACPWMAPPLMRRPRNSSVEPSRPGRETQSGARVMIGGVQMRVLLADDHTLVRAGLRGLVAAIAGVEIVAETGDGQEALALILELKPDVALVDISMPGLNGLELASRVAREAPRTRVAILSMHGTPGHVAQVLRAGVKGYVLKDAAAEELPLLLRAVMRGETYLSPAISRHVVDAYLDRDGTPKVPPP